VRLLVDTQSLIWFVTDDPLLSTAARTALESGRNQLRVSAATFWEMGIKLRIGKLSLPVSFPEFIRQSLDTYRMSVEPILPLHSEMISILPLHHRDPFDRMIVAQATAGGMTVVSSDSAFDLYGVPRIW
jgi:PIN domain nuclease of toxin-antitoxin system